MDVIQNFTLRISSAGIREDAAWELMLAGRMLRLTNISEVG